MLGANICMEAAFIFCDPSLLANCALLILRNGPGHGAQVSCVPLSLGSQVHDLELGLKIIAREKCKHVFLEETIQIEGKKNLVQLLQLLQFKINYPRKEPLTNDFCILSAQKIYNPKFSFRKISFVMDGL